MSTTNKSIKITCETKDSLLLKDLTEFQGELKARDEKDVDKIVKSIKKYGFSFPFFVWKHNKINHVLDGHGRLKALHKLDDLGFEIPELPVVYVQCKDEESAKDLLLRLNSSYGKMTKESVLEFIGDFELDLSNFELPCGAIDFLKEDKPKLEEDESIEMKEKFELVVSCESSEQQEELFYKLSEEGYVVKILTL